MKDKLLCDVILLDQNKNFGLGTILDDTRNGHRLCLSTNPNLEQDWKAWDKTGGCTFRPKHLYLTSNREIKEGDWFFNGTDVYEAAKGGYHKDYQKVEATTHPFLGLPLIPQSFIEEYVQKEGKIDKVYIKFERVADPCSKCTTDCYNWQIGDCRDYKTVIEILPAKDSFKRDEVRDIWLKYQQYFNVTQYDMAGNPMSFSEWFDKNY